MFPIWLAVQQLLTVINQNSVTASQTPYPCSAEMALTYSLGYSLTSLKEWGLAKEDCFDRLHLHESWTDNIVYCPNHLFCGTNLTFHFLNSFRKFLRLRYYRALHEVKRDYNSDFFSRRFRRKSTTLTVAEIFS